MADSHLARLLFDGPRGSGRYTPDEGARVRLDGRDEVLDAVVYFHEVHHCVLNDGTAWGILLHVLAHVPEQPLGSYLDTMRTTHETFATYSSVGTVEAHHGPTPYVLDAYPAYASLHTRMTALLTEVAGTNRKLTLATTLARVCMQAPVLEIAAQIGIDVFSLADVRAADLPDQRWARLLARGPETIRRIAETADASTASVYGRDLIDADIAGERLAVTSAAEHDEHWAKWEIAAYEAVRRELPEAAVLDYAGHQEQAAEIVRLVPALRLRGTTVGEPRLDDLGLRGAVLQQMTHDLQERERLPAKLVSLPADRLVTAVTATSVVNDLPHLFVDVRQSTSLTEQYDWDGMPPSGGPVTSVRLVHIDGTILHRVVDSVAELHELAEEWGHRGPVVCCIATSCLADTRWNSTWMGELPGSRAVLVDVEAERFLPGWRDRGAPVRATRLLLDGPAGAVVILVVRLEGDQHSWFAMGDRITTALLLDQLRGTLGEMLTESLPDEELADARAAAIHVLHTESYIGFSGLKGQA